jgi:thioredoxin-related protein
MKLDHLVVCLLLAAGTCSCAGAVDAGTAANVEHAANPSGQGDGIAWRKGDVEGAFAQARKENKPVFLYWGAVWCPPCNQVKATIFNRQDFIERSRAFVAVYIDGDSPNAQQLGARFKVSGYPSMLLFRPDGTEITRLPGEVDGRRYVEVLALGMNNGRPVGETLKKALAGDKSLSEEDWRMLAYYSWETDEDRLVPREQVPSILTRLAKACPTNFRDPSQRLALEAINARATAKAPPEAAEPGAYPALMKVLSDPPQYMQSFDVLTDSVGATARYVTATKPAEREALVRNWDAMLEKSSNDPTLSQTDRLGAVSSRIELARVLQPKGDLPANLVDEVRRQVDRADHETTNAYERQSVINVAAQVLGDAGLLDASDALLKAELTRSHSPYYFMVDLASNAKKRGDKAGAVDWLSRAYAASEGPATRLQWGTLYVRGLTDLTPENATEIERVSGSIIGELAGNADLAYERNRASLARLGKALLAWNKGHQHDESMSRISAKLSGVCAGALEDGAVRASCDRFFIKPGKSA